MSNVPPSLHCPLTGKVRAKCDHCGLGIADHPAKMLYCGETGNPCSECPCNGCKLRRIDNSSPPKSSKPKVQQKSAHEQNAAELLEQQRRFADERVRHFTNEKMEDPLTIQAKLRANKANQEQKRRVKGGTLEAEDAKTVTFKVLLGKVKYQPEVSLVASVETSRFGAVDVEATYGQSGEDVINAVLTQTGIRGRCPDEFDLIHDKSRLNVTKKVKSWFMIATKSISQKSRILHLCLKDETWLIPHSVQSSPASSPPPSAPPRTATALESASAPLPRVRPRVILPLLTKEREEDLLTSEADFPLQYLQRNGTAPYNVRDFFADEDDFGFGDSVPSGTQAPAAEAPGCKAPSPVISIDCDTTEVFFDAVEPPSKKHRAESEEHPVKKNKVEIKQLMEIGATARPPPIMFQEGAGSGTAIHVSFDESMISAIQLAEPVKSGSTKEVWTNVLVSHCLFEGKTWVLKKPKTEAANGVQLDGVALLRSELYIREIVCAVCDAWNSENDQSSHFIAPRMILMTLSGCLSSVMKNMEELSKVWVFEEQVVGPLEKVITNVGEVNDMLQDDYPELAHSVIEDAEAFIHKSYAVLEGKALILDVELLMTASGPRYILDCQICFWGKFNHDFQRFYGYGNSGEQGYRAFVKTHRICGKKCPKGPYARLERPKSTMTVETTVFQRIPLQTHVVGPSLPSNPSVASNPNGSIALPVVAASIASSPTAQAITTPVPIDESVSVVISKPPTDSRVFKFDKPLDDTWEGVRLCKNAYALVLRDSYYEPGLIVNHFPNEPFPFKVVAATGRPPFPRVERSSFHLAFDADFLTCPIHPYFHRYLEGYIDTHPVLDELVLRQLKQVVPLVQEILDGKRPSDLRDAKLTGNFKKLRLLGTRKTHRGDTALAEGVEVMLTEAETEMFERELSAQFVIPPAKAVAGNLGSDLNGIRWFSEVIIPEVRMHLNELRQQEAEKAAEASGHKLITTDFVRSVFVRRNLYGQGLPSNNPSKLSNNPSKSPKTKSPQKRHTSKASAVYTSSAAVSTPEGIGRATRRTARMMTAPPGWTVCGTYMSDSGVTLAAVVPEDSIEVSKDLPPDCPIGWNVQWCDDINNWYAQPEYPDGWTLGWSSTQSAWYFVDASDKSWWGIPKESKATVTALDKNDADLDDFEEIRTVFRSKEKKKRKKDGTAVGSDAEECEKQKKKSKKKKDGIIIVVAHDDEVEKKKKKKKKHVGTSGEVAGSDVGEAFGEVVEAAGEDLSGDIETLLNVLASAAESAAPGSIH